VNSDLPSSLLRARLQLMLRHPYLAVAVARYPLRLAERAEWCLTMATDGYNIFVNSEFAASLTEDETMAVLAHEVFHCLLGHMDRRGSRNRNGWNVAIDHATNLFLSDSGFKLPEFPKEVLNQFDKSWQKVVYVQVGVDGKPQYVLIEKGSEDQRINSTVVRQIYRGRQEKTGTACEGRISLNYGLQ
jgi:predicted metal-dependent peptidase